MLSRRQFIKAAALAGVAAAVPPALGSLLDEARAASGSSPTGFFLDRTRWATCRALCARIVPTGSDPATDPGATEAAAVVFIDRFLSAFELPASVADGPAVYLRGRWSGRNPYAGPDGQPGSQYPPDDFLDASGTAHFLGMTPAQVLSWRYQLYGTAELTAAPPWALAWARQVGTLIPSPTPAGGLRQAYRDGLDAFDAYSKSLFGTPYASASPEEQDLMLAAAGNVILDAVTGSLPTPPPSPPAAPPAASALFPIITLHTFQATYGLPEYAWRNQADDPSVRPLQGTAEWRAIGYDGDTQPLGNSLFDAGMYGPGEGPNQGFGAAPGSDDAAAGVFVPFGGYREFRPVSTLDQGGGVVLGEAEQAAIERALDGVKGRDR
ncbi:MAG TPA: gluconate 2-dehydrogenase subunit 3 family protein [Acidimicrobiales bacterium]|nr:gluconate 2-dehydrogenase subunit 3 family protein [Acidimicrobiales bacterium]